MHQVGQAPPPAVDRWRCRAGAGGDGDHGHARVADLEQQLAGRVEHRQVDPRVARPAGCGLVRGWFHYEIQHNVIDVNHAVRLLDLAEPTFDPEVEEMRCFLTAMVADCPLDADVLHAKARQETGLDDFGPEDYRPRLDVFLDGVRQIGGLSEPGIVNFHLQLLQLLKNRLLLTDLLRRHPEIHEIELEPPVVIAGLPRTGTTHLHNLLAAGPTFRVLRYWESVEPYPLPAEAGIQPDPRLARTDQTVWFMNLAMPHFPLMHEMTTQHVHEEIQLIANDFSGMLLETVGHVPATRDAYLAADQTPHYEHLALQLKALQHLRGGRRWLLSRRSTSSSCRCWRGCSPA